MYGVDIPYFNSFLSTLGPLSAQSKLIEAVDSVGKGLIVVNHIYGAGQSTHCRSALEMDHDKIIFYPMVSGQVQVTNR